MKAIGLAIVGAVISALAFPPVGPGWLIVPGVAVFLLGVRQAANWRDGLMAGLAYGLVFFGGVIWWLAELELIALVLVPVQALFFAAYGGWLAHHNSRSPGVWLLLAVGGWGFMEMLRYRIPVGGFEWGATGYALSDHAITRFPAAVVGVSGLTIMVALLGAILALVVSRKADRWVAVGAGVAILLVGGTGLWVATVPIDDGEPVERVAIVQGSTPCPFEHCPPNERLRTYEQHLELTRTLEEGTVGLVVWSEGSTGSSNADPVLNPEVGEAIAAEARRLDAWFLVGSDRPVSDTHWINANVVFSSEGEIVGEYNKQHPVPFGEYIPLRPLFDWIPALRQVPRDQIPGDTAVVFDTGDYVLGSVISFEGGFTRYPRQHRRAGAEVMVVATNEASYGMAPTSEQFIGMTRMRAVELGVPVVHAAVTGKSTIIDPRGEMLEPTGLGTREILMGEIGPAIDTPFTRIGDFLLYLAAFAGVVMWLWTRSRV